MLVVHGEQEFDYVRPIRIGDKLAVRPGIADIQAKGSNEFLTIEAEVTDEAGERVLMARSTLISRGTAAPGVDHGRDAEVRRGERRRRAAAVREGGQARGREGLRGRVRDQNPLHQDDAFAQSVGFPDQSRTGCSRWPTWPRLCRGGRGTPPRSSAWACSSGRWSSWMRPSSRGAGSGMDPETKRATVDVWVTVDRAEGDRASDQTKHRRGRAGIAADQHVRRTRGPGSPPALSVPGHLLRTRNLPAGRAV